LQTTPIIQRTGLSKENALLRAELEVLRQQNQELSSRLRASEGKRGSAGGGGGGGGGGSGGGSPVKAGPGQGAGVLRAAAEQAQGERARAVADAGENGNRWRRPRSFSPVSAAKSIVDLLTPSALSESPRPSPSAASTTPTVRVSSPQRQTSRSRASTPRGRPWTRSCWAPATSRQPRSPAAGSRGTGWVCLDQLTELVWLAGSQSADTAACGVNVSQATSSTLFNQPTNPTDRPTSPSDGPQELAASFGFFPEISTARAAQWRAVAPPPSAMLEAARLATQGGGRRQQQQQQHKQQQVGECHASGGSASGSIRTSGDSVSSGATAATTSSSGGSDGSGSSLPVQYQLWWMARRGQQQQQGECVGPDHPTAADLVGVELGLRQLHELGVEGAVLAMLAERARVRRATVQLPQAVSSLGHPFVPLHVLSQRVIARPLVSLLSTNSTNTQPQTHRRRRRQQGTAHHGLLPVTLTPEEAAELRFQAARLAYLWARAAAIGIEAPLSGERAEYWGWRAEREGMSLRDFTDLRHGFQVGCAAGVFAGELSAESGERVAVEALAFAARNSDGMCLMFLPPRIKR
jgi:hypothetical protein